MDKDWTERRYRNLIAHAGFEHSIYQFRASGDGFLFRYTQDGIQRAWEGTYLAMGAVETARALRPQATSDQQPVAESRKQPEASTKAVGTDGAGRASSQVPQATERAGDTSTRPGAPSRTAVHKAQGAAAHQAGTKAHEPAENPAQRASELRTAAEDVLEDFRKAGLFGPCLYWAEVFGLDHRLTSEELRQATTPLPPDSPTWQPDYATVRAIEEANQALQHGALDKAEWLCQPIVLVGRIKAAVGRSGVWIEVRGLRDFYAPAAQSLDRGCRVGTYVRFRPRVCRHSSTGKPTLMATDCEPIDDQ